MEPRLKQCYEVTLPKSKNTTRRVYINSQGIFLGKRAKLADKDWILRAISTPLATDADYYVERITSYKEGCTVRFLNLSQQPPQYQQKLFGWTELKDNPKAIITQHSLHATVQGVVSLATKTAIRESNLIGIDTALRYQDQRRSRAEEKTKLIEEARMNAEREALLEKNIQAAEAKAKQDAEAKIMADIAAGKIFFKFDSAEDKVKSAANDYKEAKFTDRLQELQEKKKSTFETCKNTIPSKKATQFTKRIEKRNKEKLDELKEKEDAITEKLKQHLAGIGSEQLTAESAFEITYNCYDQSIVSQQRKTLLNAINQYKDTSNWNEEAMRTLALALRIDPRDIKFDHATAGFYNALQNKTRKEMADLFFVMDQSLSSKVGGKEKYKDHPFIPLFKAAYVESQTELFEDAVKKEMKKELSSLRTTAEKKITSMHEEIIKDFTTYQESLAKYSQFLEKEKQDFIAIQKLLATAETQATTTNDKPIPEFSRLTNSILKMQEQARVLQEAIKAKEQEYKLPASDQGKMVTFTKLTHGALAIIKQEEESFIREQKQLPDKLGKTDISLEQARQDVRDTQSKQENSLQRSRQQEEITETALTEIQSRHDRVIAEAEQIAMREKLYTTLETMLIDQVDYWKKQQSMVGGTDVLENSGKKTNVPTGIGEMITIMDKRRKPVVNDEKKSTSSLSRFFKNNTNPIPPLSLEERKVPPEVVRQRLKDLQVIASKRVIAKDFLGRTKKHAGRTDATTDFYNKLIAISEKDLTDTKKLAEHIKAFNESPAKQAQDKVLHKPRK